MYSVPTLIALHRGSVIFNKEMKMVEIGRFWPNIPQKLIVHSKQETIHLYAATKDRNGSDL